MSFNDALLAKLSWRLLQSPDSLLGQTLLGKYCHSIRFLDCPIPSSASHGWRGILAGREVLKLGLGWVVGDGKNINVRKDPWLSTSSPLRPIGPPCADNKSLRVIDLISPVSLDWDVTAIKTHLPQYEDTIRKLVPSQMDMADSLHWLPEKSGNYSTRSGYALAKLQASPDLPSPSFAWKRNVWNLQCSPKLNLFLWKAASGALPVGSALSRRGMTSDTVCKRCGAEESEIHVLLHCPFAAKVWDLTPSLFKPSPSINTVPLLLQACSKSVNLPPTGLCSPLFPWILWNLWTGRNQLIFEDKKYTEQEVVSKALRDALAWSKAQLPRQKPRSCPQFDHHIPSNHLTRGSGNSLSIECFSDAAWQESNGNCGLGWTFQTMLGTPLHKGTSSRRCVASAIAAEAQAIKSALLAAANAGYRDLEVFSDCKSLVTLINSNVSSVALKSLLYDISVLSRNFSSISFTFTPRVNNVVADGLAKSALSSLCNPSFME